MRRVIFDDVAGQQFLLLVTVNVQGFTIEGTHELADGQRLLLSTKDLNMVGSTSIASSEEMECFWKV